MNKKVLFYSFSVVFLIFAFASNQYWGAKMITQDNSVTEGAGFLSYSVISVVIVSLYWYISRSRLKNIRGVHAICFLWVVVMPFIMFLTKANKSYYFMTILWPLVFEAGFIITNKERIKIERVQFLFFFIFLIGLYFFIESRINIGKLVQSNTIYFPFLTLPFFLCVKDKGKILFFILLLMSFLGIISFKRSIWLIIAFIWLAYFGSLIKRKTNFFVIITIVIAIIVASDYVLDSVDKFFGGAINERLEKSEADERGGRLGIWTYTWGMIQTSSTTEIVIGHGHFGVRNDSILGLSAHNDILEVIYDYGLIIFSLYISLWIYVFRRLRKLYQMNSPYSFPYMVSCIIFMVLSIVSHLILYTSYFNYLVLFWGCIEGILSRNEYKEKVLAIRTSKKI